MYPSLSLLLALMMSSCCSECAATSDLSESRRGLEGGVFLQVPQEVLLDHGEVLVPREVLLVIKDSVKSSERFSWSFRQF